MFLDAAAATWANIVSAAANYVIDRLKQASSWKSSPVKTDVQYSVAAIQRFTKLPFPLHLLHKSQLLSFIIKLYLGTFAIVVLHQRPASVCLEANYVFMQVFN